LISLIFDNFIDPIKASEFSDSNADKVSLLSTTKTFLPFAIKLYLLFSTFLI